MKVNIHMKCIDTGEIRVLRDQDWWRHSTFAWGRETGNFGCDCNRHEAFERVLDPRYDDEHLGQGFECGHGAYEIVLIDMDDGRVVVAGEPDPDFSDPSWPAFPEKA